MVVVEQLAAELEIQLAAELVDAFANPRRLQLDVFLVIETNALGHRKNLFLIKAYAWRSGFELRICQPDDYSPKANASMNDS